MVPMSFPGSALSTKPVHNFVEELGSTAAKPRPCSTRVKMTNL